MTTSAQPELPPSFTADDSRLAFERAKWDGECKLRERELALREADRPSPWRSPLTIAVVAAAMAAAGNAVVTQLNGSAQVRLQLAQDKAGADLEKIKAEQNLIIEAIKTGGDVDKAAANLEFLVKAGLVTDAQRAKNIRQYLALNRLNPERLPSLPSVGQTQPPAPRRALPATETVYSSPRDNPALKVTNRAREIVPGKSCRAGSTGSYCVANDVLVDAAGKPITVADAKYHGDRMQSPKLIVFHSTYGDDRSTVRSMTAGSVGSSAHVIIDRDGTMTQLVPFDVISAHVSKSVSWNGLTDINHHSIAIEFSNWGELKGSPGAWHRGDDDKTVPDDRVFTTPPDAQGAVHGWERFTDAQLAAAERVVAALVRRYPSIREIVGHSDLSGSDFPDPGPALPIERLRALIRK